MFKLFHNEVPACNRPYFAHSHPEYEITVFISGKGIYTVDRKKDYDVQPGDVFIFRSNEEHFMGTIEPGHDVRTIGIHFLPQMVLSQSSNLFDIKYLRAFLNKDSSFENRLPRGTSASADITSLMEQMKNEADQKLPDYELMIKVKLLAILVEINRHYEFSADTDLSHITNEHFFQISRSMKYIDDHLTEELRLDDLAAVANMSTSYFSHIFKTVNRVSPLDYIIRKRIDLAMDELQQTNKSILEIAYHCGFNNTANFNRAFRNKIGVVPSDYRKQARLNILKDYD
ncbi:MAG: helix-turn-helix transcriptional regulator [Firmicutes bacterium]|nr:helix-turn-helix transcriptional regulator [Bacillota bacterium]